MNSDTISPRLTTTASLKRQKIETSAISSSSCWENSMNSNKESKLDCGVYIIYISSDYVTPAMIIIALAQSERCIYMLLTPTAHLIALSLDYWCVCMFLVGLSAVKLNICSDILFFISADRFNHKFNVHRSTGLKTRLNNKRKYLATHVPMCHSSELGVQRERPLL